MHDRLAIHELLHRWWYSYDEGLFDVWPELFTEDAWFTSRTDRGDHPHEAYIASDNRGRDKVLAWQREHRVTSPYPLRHNATNVHVDSEAGEDVSVTSYIDVTHIVNGLPAALASGVVRAVARRDDGTYRFAAVHVVLDTVDSAPLGESTGRPGA
ncbi:nuclear transport factor 2 family protein [Streptomyces phaeochromogenes]|uniref:nuclear transport factor 2 family protein n=1 Tax=Streptomyces phaeochromogenes TaxID=1923 RepID=UPI003691E8DF